MTAVQPSFDGKLVKLDFTTTQKKKINTWVKSHARTPQELLHEFTDAQWKFSVSFSDYFGCYYVSLTCKDQYSPYHKQTLSLRHSDMIKGMNIMSYVLAEMVQNEDAQLPVNEVDTDW